MIESMQCMHTEDASIPRVRRVAQTHHRHRSFLGPMHSQPPNGFLGIRGIFATGFYRKDERIRKWSYKQCHVSLTKHRPKQGPTGKVELSVCDGHHGLIVIEVACTCSRGQRKRVIHVTLMAGLEARQTGT